MNAHEVAVNAAAEAIRDAAINPRKFHAEELALEIVQAIAESLEVIAWVTKCPFHGRFIDKCCLKSAMVALGGKEGV